MIIVQSSDPRFSSMLRASGYRKKTACVVVCESVTLSGGYWDGGSRSQYSLVAPTFSRLSYPTNPPQFGGGYPPAHTLEDGQIVLRTGVFCGKPAMAYLYMNATTAAQYGI